MKQWRCDGTDVLSLLLSYLTTTLLLCRTANSQYSSDQCSWKGSGLAHEGHTREVEQVYLRCSRGSLEWLYPTGAIIVNLRPNTMSQAAQRLTVCIKPFVHSRGSNIYLDKASQLRLLLTEDQQALGHVHCFGIQEGALFIEAIPYRDISRRITAFQYELVSARQAPSTGPCQSCSNEEVLMAVCTSDFVARGSVHRVEEEEDLRQLSVTVTLSWLYRQKSNVFVPGGGRAKRWTGRVKMPSRCRVDFTQGTTKGDEFLLTGTIRFGEAWLGCAWRYTDFLIVYRTAVEQRTNPCHVDTH